MRAQLLAALLLAPSLLPSLAAEEPPTPAKPAADGRRTGRLLLANYGRGLAGVISRDSLKPFLITGVAAGVGTIFDDDVQRYFSAERRAKWLGDAGEQLGKPVVIVPMALGLFGVGRLSHHQGFRDATYDILEVTAVGASYSSDVLAGAGLGYISARSVMRKSSEALRKAPAATLAFAPMRDPRGQGAGLLASWAF